MIMPFSEFSGIILNELREPLLNSTAIFTGGDRKMVLYIFPNKEYSNLIDALVNRVESGTLTVSFQLSDIS